MLDLFTIFTKGGIVLWCFRGTQEIFTSPVNALIRSVILQVKKKQNQNKLRINDARTFFLPKKQNYIKI